MLDAFCRHMVGNLAMARSRVTPSPARSTTGAGTARAVHRHPLRASCSSGRQDQGVGKLERNGLFFVYNDPEGNPPPAEVTIPQIEGYDEGGWSDWSWNTYVVEGSHCREIVDNVVDMAHFFYVHFQIPTYFKNVFEGHVATQVMRSGGRDDIQTVSSSGWPRRKPFRTLRTSARLSCSTPSTRLPATSRSRRSWRTATTHHEQLVHPAVGHHRQADRGVVGRGRQGDGGAVHGGRRAPVQAGHRDLDHKSRIENPLLTEEDGPVYQLRRWYQQFYVDVADVTEDMTKRFEFEVDTTRAQQNWRDVVADNVANGVKPVELVADV